MGGEVTVYSGAAEAGMLGISWKLSPGMSNPGICMPLIGGMPPIILDISLDIIDDEEELENEDEDVLLDEEFMFMDPMFDIIFPIISSMPREGMAPMPPPMDIMSGIPPIDMPPGMGPPEDIIVEDDDEEEEDLRLKWLIHLLTEWLQPCSGCLPCHPF